MDYSEEDVLANAQDYIEVAPPHWMQVLHEFYASLGLTDFQGNYFFFLLFVFWPCCRILKRTGISLWWLAVFLVPIILPFASPLFVIFPLFVILAHKKWPHKYYAPKKTHRKTVSHSYEDDPQQGDA